MDYLVLMDFCEDCYIHIINVYGPLKADGENWLIKRKTPSGKSEWILFFGLSDVFRIKVCPCCGHRSMKYLNQAHFPDFKQLQSGIINGKRLLEAQGYRVLFADYSEPETLSDATRLILPI